MPDAAGFDPVVFDLDGTVVDTVELIVESFRFATRSVLDEVLPDEVILAGVGQPLMAQMERLSADHARELYDVYREYNHRRHDELIRGYEGVSDVLGALNDAGRRLGIVTSKSSDTTEHKPSPVPLHLCLERLGAQAEGSLYVGDAPADIAAGRAAGMATAAVAWGVFGRDVLLAAGPDFWLDEPRDLLTLCLSGVGVRVSGGEGA